MVVRKVFKLSQEALQGQWTIEHRYQDTVFLASEGDNPMVIGVTREHFERVFSEKEIIIMMTVAELKAERNKLGG